MLNILAILLGGFVLFELMEHILFPLVWSIIARKRLSACGMESMMGKEVQVVQWYKTKGRVRVNGELWSASGSHSFSSGDKAIVQGAEGLVLKVAPIEE
jgi:membrane-bound ClpP family serine protease